MERPWLAENDAERARLVALVARLSDEELSRPMPDGWTVAAVLAHMAFWDARVLHFIDKWEGGIAPSEADREQGDADWINNATKLLCLALPPRTAANLALQLAQDTDRRVAMLSDDLIEQMLAVGDIIDLSRAEHRGAHLDEIEGVVQGPGKLS